jgi:hypothetical protein
MGKRRRLRKSGGGELEVNMQDVASDEAILPSVVELEVNMQDVASDEAILPSVVELEVNMQVVASDEAILPSVVELEVNMQDVASDEAIFPSVAVEDVAILLPYVAGRDEGVVESGAAIIQQNVASDEATSEQDVASDEEMGEQNAALSQLKYKDSISIDCFRMCGHQIKYRLKKLYKFF